MKTLIFLLVLLSSILFAAVPNKPTNLQELTGTNDTNITIGWDYVSGADGYHVYEVLQNNGGVLPPTYELKATTDSATNLYELSSLDPYSKHTYAVDAFNTDGNSTSSATVTIQTLHTWRGSLKTCLLDQLHASSDHVPTRQDVESVTTFNCPNVNVNYWGGSIRDIDELRDLVYVRDLNISGGIYTPFPQWIGELDHLFSLKLDGKFSGTIPADIGNKIPNLLFFEVVGDNSPYASPEMLLRGLLPASFGEMHDLKVLSIRGDLNGSVPAGLGTLGNLQTLDLRGNHFTSVPSELANLASLQYLDLRENNLTTLPDLSPLATTLTTLNLSQLSLNAFSAWIGSLSHLEHLDYSYTPIDSRLPEAIKNLTALKSLKLQHCGLQGTIPDWIGNLTALEKLYLSSNVLFGSIPYSITNLTNIPDSWGQLQLNENCNLFSNNVDVQTYIHDKSCNDPFGGGICYDQRVIDYDQIVQSNTHQCDMGLSPIRAFLLLN